MLSEMFFPQLFQTAVAEKRPLWLKAEWVVLGGEGRGWACHDLLIHSDWALGSGWAVFAHFFQKLTSSSSDTVLQALGGPKAGMGEWGSRSS